MAEIGQVVVIKDDIVQVKLQRHDACDHCNACSAGVETKEMLLDAENHCAAKLGDLVEVNIEESNFLTAVAIMYIIPLAGLLIGIAGGYLLARRLGLNEEVVGLITGFVILIITYLIIKGNENKFRTRKFRPIASNIVKRNVN